MLVSYPKRLWARNALASGGLPESAQDAFAELAERHDVVTRFVAHEVGPWDEHVEVTLFPQARRHARVPLGALGTLLTTAAPTDGDALSSVLVLVCTHGVRDRCCARFGGALVRALRDAARGCAVEVREASHLGGDRFAPVVLVLPSGHMYGHVLPEEAPRLVEAALGAPVLRERFRGTLWRDPLEQVLETVALERAPEGAPWPRIGPIARTMHDDDRATLRAEVAVGDDAAMPLEVDCARERRLVIGDCRSADRARQGSVAVWRATSVR